METQGKVQLEELTLQPSTPLVIVPGNRFHPKEAMWISFYDQGNDSFVRSDTGSQSTQGIPQHDVVVAFPYPFWGSPCHLIFTESRYGALTVESYSHLTPLTSFFRSENSQLVKIPLNLRQVLSEYAGQLASGKEEAIDKALKGTRYTIAYFSDRGHEQKFRDILRKTFDNQEDNVSFLEIAGTQEDVSREAFKSQVNLLLKDGRMRYSLGPIPAGYMDVSGIGRYNPIEIGHFE